MKSSHEKRRAFRAGGGVTQITVFQFAPYQIAKMLLYDPYQLVQNEASKALAPVTNTSLWQSLPLRWIPQVVERVYNGSILHFLARLYIYGPQIGGIGFWQGRTPEQICAQLSPSNEAFWGRNPDECHQIISRHFYSWVVLLEVSVYFFWMYKTLRWLSKACNK